MEMDSVLAGGKIDKVKFKGHALPMLREDDGAYVLTIGVFECDLRLGGAGQSGNGEE